MPRQGASPLCTPRPVGDRGLQAKLPRTGLFPLALALYCRRDTASAERNAGRFAIASSMLRPLRRGWALAALLALGVALEACGGDNVPATPVGAGADGTLEVVHRNYTFEPKGLVFEVGETVEFHLVSADGPHTFTVEDLGIDWVVTTQPDPQVQTFTFERKGTFRLVCEFPGHEGSGMVGTVEVR